MVSFAIPFLFALFQLQAAAKVFNFTIELTWTNGNPDGGSLRRVIHVNGTSPGPALEMDYGDTVNFLTINHMPLETAIHFHGIQQFGTPWADGVPGLTQRPIPPGESFLQSWTAQEYGTYFYHAHEKSQISDGCFGAIVIRPPPELERPFDVISKEPADIAAIREAELDPKIAFISDWQPTNAIKFRQLSKETGLDFLCTQSILINGKGSIRCLGAQGFTDLFNPALVPLLGGGLLTDTGCLPPDNPIAEPPPVNLEPLKYHRNSFYGCKNATGGTEVFEVDAAKGWVSLNFISSASVQAPIISIDKHQMWVYEVNGHYVVPQLVDSLQIVNGERYSVLVKLDQTPSNYTLRAINFGANQVQGAFATLAYKGATVLVPEEPKYTYGGSNTTLVKQLSPTVPPFGAPKVAAKADETFIFVLERLDVSWRWTLKDSTAMPLDFSSKRPILYNPTNENALNETFSVRTQNGSWVDLIFTVSPTQKHPIQPPHPMHKHGVKAYIIGSGPGEFPGKDVAEAQAAAPQFFDLENAPFTDTFVTPPMQNQSVWLAVRYHSVNPGAWLLHCHIQTHLAGGMAQFLLDGVDKFPQVPRSYARPPGNPYVF